MQSARQPVPPLFLALLSILGLSHCAYLIFVTQKTPAIFNLGIDTKAYLDLGQHVAEHGLTAIPDTHPPGHLLYVALAFLTSPSPILAIKCCNLALMVGIACLTLYIGRQRFSTSVGQIAAAIVCLSPGLMAYAATVQYEVLATFLLTATIALQTRTLLSRSTSEILLWGNLAALCCAAGTLTREPLIVMAPAIVLSIYPLVKYYSPQPRLVASSFIVTFSLPIIIWIGYQWMSKGVLIPISAKSSINLAIGNNPVATGAFNQVRDGLQEPSGLHFLLQNPIKGVVLLLRKCLYLWGFLRDGWNVPRVETPLLFGVSLGLIPYTTCSRLSQCIFTLLALIGCVRTCRKESQQYGRLGAYLLVATTIFYLPFIASYRFLVPLLPVIYLFVAVELDRYIRFFMGLEARVILALPVGAFIAYTILRPPAVALNLRGDQLDGVAITTTPPNNENDEPSIFAAAEPGPRLVAFYPPEYLPAHVYTLRITYRTNQTPGSGNGKFGFALARTLGNTPVCQVPLRLPTTTAKRMVATTTCTLPYLSPLSIEVVTTVATPLWIDSVELTSNSAS